MKSKMIKDPMYGFIEFEGEFELGLKDMLSDPFFQRLRRVKQLGFSDYVFPSATHSRFAHSLGVFSVAKKMLAIVEPDVRQGKWSRQGKACLAAALLHDVGHGMFSHAFEKAMSFYFDRNPNVNERSDELRNAVSHENVSHKIVTQSSISDLLTGLVDNDFPTQVADMISKKEEGCVYTSIVSGQLDADRLDYAKRDPYFAGVSSGSIDLDWLLRNLKPGKNADIDFLYVDSKAYISLEQFAVTLFQLYPTIYFHKRTRGLEYMFSLLMSRVFELIAKGHELKAGLSSGHPFVRFFKDPADLQNALVLDDTLFWGSLYLFQEAEEDSISTLAKRISARKIFPMVDIWKVVDEFASSNVDIQNLTAPERVDKLNSICKEVSAEISKNDNIWVEGCYYDSANRPIYKKKNVIGGHPQQINIEVGGKIVDIATISPIVASAASFNIHRIYFDDTVNGNAEKLESAVRVSVGNHLQS